MVPNDPLYGQQWYLGLLGDIQTIWNEYNGAGVHVGVYDSGVDSQHIEFKGRYDASRHVVVNGLVRSGAPNDASSQPQSHGTNCAGIIAAGNNNTGMIGIAWGSFLTGVNIFDTTAPQDLNASDPSGFLQAVRQMTKFDVVNNSWGSKPNFTSAGNLSDPSSYSAKVATEYNFAATTGRGGLGTVILQSAGNDSLDSNGNGLNASRHTVTVAAARQDGFASSYSNYGASVLVAAPGSETEGSILTTDRTGAPGVTAGDYHPGFNGTSAAAPMVSGVVALMFDANAGLGWRDVQTILAASARHTGSAIGAGQLGTNENGFWHINGADNWNGGGMHFSDDYGYGMVDAYKAVRMAEAWTYFSPKAQTSANEVAFSTGDLPVNGSYIPDGSYLNVTLDISEAMIIEHIDLTLTFQHGNFNYLNIYAYSPEGTRVLLHDGTAGDWNAAVDGLTWTFGIDSLRGELLAGTWTIQFVDTYPETADGFFTNVDLTAYGTRPSVDDVYHYTSEFNGLSSQNSARLTLSDSDGGVDWINASAVATASIINLAAGATSTIAGKSVTMGTGLIENVVTGDGNDVIRANSAINKLVGGRGNDTYYVNGAADLVIERAGQGSDTVMASVSYALAAGQAIERLATTWQAGTIAINLTGNALGQRIDGNAGANTLNGLGGADAMYGYGGNDIFRVDNAGDTIFEAAGQGSDIVYTSVSYTLAAGQAIERLVTTSQAATTAINLTGNALGQQLNGNAGANTLNGLGGADAMYGYGGNDIFVVDNAGDTTFDAAGQGSDTVIAGLSYTLAAGQAIERLATTSQAGTAAINLTGNALGQQLNGNAGANTLNGLGGADVMYGYGGNDIFVVDNVSDKTFEAANQGTDIVYASVSYALAAGQAIERLATTSQAGTTAINLTGNALGQQLNGNAGANTLNGLGGSDTLSGFNGNDRLLGGTGLDFLTGGTGNDVFVFSAVTESGATSALADRILDLASGDRIDLRGIDANAGLANDQGFVFDQNGSFSAGEMRQTVSGGNVLLDFNTDTDAAVEMSILLINHGAVGSGDFFL